jgi:hypothetical protein
LPSYPGIFAVGDIIDWKEQKQAAKANGHAPVVVVNVLHVLAGKRFRMEYKGFPEMIMITNGKVRKSRLWILLFLTRVRNLRMEGPHSSLTFGELCWAAL